MAVVVAAVAASPDRPIGRVPGAAEKAAEAEEVDIIRLRRSMSMLEPLVCPLRVAVVVAAAVMAPVIPQRLALVEVVLSSFAARRRTGPGRIRLKRMLLRREETFRTARDSPSIHLPKTGRLSFPNGGALTSLSSVAVVAEEL